MLKLIKSLFNKEKLGQDYSVEELNSIAKDFFSPKGPDEGCGMRYIFYDGLDNLENGRGELILSLRFSTNSITKIAVVANAMKESHSSLDAIKPHIDAIKAILKNNI
jgi:hypothetical protein